MIDESERTGAVNAALADLLEGECGDGVVVDDVGVAMEVEVRARRAVLADDPFNPSPTSLATAGGSPSDGFRVRINRRNR